MGMMSPNRECCVVCAVLTAAGDVGQGVSLRRKELSGAGSTSGAALSFEVNLKCPQLNASKVKVQRQFDVHLPAPKVLECGQA